MILTRLNRFNGLTKRFFHDNITTNNERFSRHASRMVYAINPNKVPKACSAKEALSNIKSGDNIFVHGAAATPTYLLKHLSEVIAEKKLTNLKAYHIHMEGEGFLTHDNMAGCLRSNSLFTGANCRKAIEKGTADFIPIFLSNIPKNFRNNNIKLNYALVQVSPPDEHGFVTLGTSVDAALAACEKADVIVALVNKRMPRIFGDGVIHMSNIDYFVHVDQNLHYAHDSTPSEEEIKIGRHIVENLIDDGATLQMGIGSIPTAVMTQIKRQKNLGLHTEMVSDPIVDLIQSGIINNSQKVIHRGKSVSSFSIGSQKLYDFMHNNPSFLMLDVTFTNDPMVICQNPKVVSINSCIEVDLTGQIVSDSVGTKIHSGVGGQVDFVTGAIFSRDGLGKTIITLQSQTKKKESKIVSCVKEGAGVTTSRNHAQYVVTEYGIASLYGKNLRQRAYELIKVAHPDHRESLEKAAFNRLKSMPSHE